MANQIPHFKATQNSKQLIVDGEAFLMLAAELQNSSMTSAKYMKEVWPKLTKCYTNTVLGCTTWEQIEPEEGKFDFAQLNEVIIDAREHGMRIVLLWFGSFKNGLSTYAPAWVKKDIKRFPRAKLRKAGGEMKIADVVSTFHNEARDCDARAFSKLTTHLKDVDGEHHTVIMVQVENEPGLLGDSRDGSLAAERRFNGPVPQDLLEKLSKEFDSLRPELKQSLKSFKPSSTGSWSEVFGKSKRTDELFMAYHYALYIEYVARAGKETYPLPLYTNVWQNADSSDADDGVPIVAGGGDTPGEYPSGGGVVNVLDIWQMFAPTLDLIAPDIYLNDYTDRCVQYRHRNQPLFIPEQRRDEYGARRVWKAFGSHQAIGTSPFGLDTLEPEDNPFKRHYGLLSRVSKHVLQAQRDSSSVGFFFDELSRDPGAKDPSPPLTARFGPWNLLIERSFVFGHPGPGSGMVIHKGDATFLLIGWGFRVSFQHESAPFTGILRFEEKEADEKGDLKTLRMLNGDETRSGAFCMMPNEEIDYGGFPICVTIHARTAIAECEVYALEDEES